MIPPATPAAPAPASALMIGPATRKAPSPGIAIVPSPASSPRVPPTSTPAPAPAVAPSGALVCFSWAKSLVPMLSASRTETSSPRKPCSNSASTPVSTWRRSLKIAKTAVFFPAMGASHTECAIGVPVGGITQTLCFPLRQVQRTNLANRRQNHQERRHVQRADDGEHRTVAGAAVEHAAHHQVEHYSTHRAAEADQS